MQMKITSKYLPAAALACGGIGLGLDWLLFRFGTDSRGLLVPGFPAGILLTAISLAYLAFMWFQVGSTEQLGTRYLPWLQILTTVCAACGICVLSQNTLRDGNDTFSLVISCLGFLAAAAMAASAFVSRIRFPALVLSSLYFAMHSVLRYRLYSADPQLQDYIFPLLAEITMMLYFHHLACSMRELDKPRIRNFWRCCGIYFSAVAICRGGLGFLMLLPWLLCVRGDEE